MRSFTRSIGLSATLVLAFGGCASSGSDAPPVTAAMVDQSGGATVETLQDGRRMFLILSMRREVPDRVTSHTTIEWHGIVTGLGKRVNLTARERSALLGYLAAANAAARLH